MKIAYLCHDILPDATANTEQIVQNVAALGRRGLSMDLIFPRAGTPRTPEQAGAELSDFYGTPADAFGDRVALIELPVPSFLKGTGRHLLHHIRGIRHIRSGRYDMIYTRDFFALWRCLGAGLPVLFETYRANLNTESRYGLWRALCYGQPNFAGVITHSEFSRQSFIRAGIAPERILVAYNGFSPESMGPYMEKAEARQRLGITGAEPVVCYAGRIGERKGTDILIEMAAALPEIRFIVVGAQIGSAGHTDFTGQIRKRGIVNMEVLPSVPPSGVSVYLYAADSLIIPPSSDPLYRHGRTVLPIKTFTYLASGRPIFAPDRPDIRETLIDGHNAVLVPPDHPQQASILLRRLLGDRGLQERLSGNAKDDARKYTWDGRADRILEFLRRIL